MAPKKNPEEYFNSPKGHIKDRIIVNPSAEYPAEGLFVSLNGYPFHLPIGVEIDIPRPVRQMLDTRIMTQTRTIDKGPGIGTVQDVKNIPRVTYRLVKEDVDAVMVEAAAGG